MNSHSNIENGSEAGKREWILTAAQRIFCVCIIRGNFNDNYPTTPATFSSSKKNDRTALAPTSLHLCDERY